MNYVAKISAFLAQYWRIVLAYVALTLLAIGFLFADISLTSRIAGVLFIVMAILIANIAVPALLQVDRIAKTYSLVVEPALTFPQYEIPPEPDKRADIRFGCAPLPDCCIPILYQRLDPKGWESLARTHALNVHFYVTNFNNLFGAVKDVNGDDKIDRDRHVDVAIASAAAVDRVAYLGLARTTPNPDAPVCVLPVLQQFNAYFLFAKRKQLVEYLRQKQFIPLSEAVLTIDADSSLHTVLESKGAIQSNVTEMNTAIRLSVIDGILHRARVLVERGADLDAALMAYWEKLNKLTNAPILEHRINFVTPVKSSIQATFDAFTASTDFTLYVGGLAQTAFLLSRSGPQGEYVIVARPNEIGYQNVNSFVCSRNFGTARRNELLRLYGWWFDLINRFRRDFLFNPSGEAKLLATLAEDVVFENSGKVHLVEHDTDTDTASMNILLDFLKCTHDADIGSFFFPNMYAASKLKNQLIEKLDANDNVIKFLHAEDVSAQAPDSASSRAAGPKPSDLRER